MAWDDRTSFDTIKKVHGLSESQVKALMKKSLKPSSYRLWRKRVYGRAAKHRNMAKHSSVAKHGKSKMKSSIWSKI